MTWYHGVYAVISAIPRDAYLVIFTATAVASLIFGGIYLTEKWQSIVRAVLRSKLFMLLWAWRYVWVTAIGKVPVHYRFVVRDGARRRQLPGIARIKKGRTIDIRFDIPEGVHTFHLVIEVPAIYKLLFPHSQSEGRWIETIASNGRRRYKTAFVTHRRNARSPEWVQIMVVTRYGEAGWGAVRETIRKNPSVWTLAHLGRTVEAITPPPPTFEELIARAHEGEE